MWDLLLSALASWMLVIEGVLAFLSPSVWRQVV